MATKFLVIDAGGQRFEFDADHGEAAVTDSGQRVVRFYSDAAGKKQIAEYSAPTSWGPAPAAE